MNVRKVKSFEMVSTQSFAGGLFSASKVRIDVLHLKIGTGLLQVFFFTHNEIH